MEDTPSNATTLASLSKGLGTAGGYVVASGLDFESPGFTISRQPRASKRKFTALNQHMNLVDPSSLVLELGLSSKSCTTGKEIEEDPPVDLGLGINLGLGSSIGIPNRKNGFGQSSDGRKSPFSNIDLQLSLSTGPTESDSTCITQDSNPHQRYSNSPAVAHGFQLFDEGSISSRWKIGTLVPPLPNTDTLQPVYRGKGSANHYPFKASSSTGVETTFPLPNQQKRKANVKICRVEGCTTGARGASGLCIAHGGGRRCQRAGCHKGAEGKTVFCKAHGGGRRCQHLGCTKSAEGCSDLCIAHGGGRRCTYNGCTRASRGKSGLCIRHGGGKRCKIENCTRSAEGHSGLCISHGGGRRCQYPECTKGAQGSTMLCKGHGGGRRCTFLGCTKGAEGSTPFCKGHGGGKRCTSEGCTKSVHGGTQFCVSHGGGKRCATPGCTKSARGRTSHCVRHGGGKRCKHDGCTKSAQGSTDFCKAHGGGRRCTWGQVFGGCDKFSRGKSGLCVAHGAVHERSEMMVSSSATVFAGGSMGYGPHEKNVLFQCATSLDRFSLPEGRVHGGGLMSMLRRGMEQRGGTSKDS